MSWYAVKFKPYSTPYPSLSGHHHHGNNRKKKPLNYLHVNGNKQHSHNMWEIMLVERGQEQGLVMVMVD
jgi:hypothetical protein